MKKLFTLTVLLMLSTPALATHNGPHIIVSVNGLVCDFCAVSMDKTFSKKPGVTDVDVNLTTKIVRIDMKPATDIGDDEIKKGITDAGFDVVSIKRN
ncbi:MAG: heavy metal-associated domain-containing protein [bacterium]|nr:heavy metal-associated domain-containing protein [bacterium]